MHSFSTALENFIFKAPNIWGRSSRSEFWQVMPIIWGLLVVFLVSDLQLIWADLRMEKTPSYNPFNYSFLLFFLITWPSRVSLTVRRLHDNGRSGKWAIAPYTAGLLAFWLILGLVSASIAARPEAGLAFGTASFGMGALVVMTDNFWPYMFQVAQQVDFWTLLDTLRQLVGTIFGQIDTQTLNPAGLAAVTSTMIFGPFILLGMWLVFLVQPANHQSNRFGAPSIPVENIKAPGKDQRQAFSGYSALASGESRNVALNPEQRRAQVAEFYRKRVLAQ